MSALALHPIGGDDPEAVRPAELLNAGANHFTGALEREQAELKRYRR
jgi:hypothetical protein